METDDRRTERRLRSDRAEGAGIPLFTLGYQGRSLREVLGILSDHAIEQVVDVRENASSRKPGFAEADLARALATAGVAYVHLPELGCAPASRHALWSGRPESSFFEEYRRRLAERPNAFPDLVNRIDAKRTVLLCLEHEPLRCHRAVLSERLRGEGFLVQDL